MDKSSLLLLLGYVVRSSAKLPCPVHIAKVFIVVEIDEPPVLGCL